MNTAIHMKEDSYHLNGNMSRFSNNDAGAIIMNTFIIADKTYVVYVQIIAEMLL